MINVSPGLTLDVKSTRNVAPDLTYPVYSLSFLEGVKVTFYFLRFYSIKIVEGEKEKRWSRFQPCKMLPSFYRETIKRLRERIIEMFI